MARGWESKAVESQQADAMRSAGTGEGRELADAEPADYTKREVLRLARARTAADLARAEAPAQRAMLERALSDLDRIIAALTVRPS